MSASRELDRSDLYARVLAAAPVGVAVTDATRTAYPVITCNAAWSALSGYPLEDISRRNAGFLIGEDTDLQTRERIMHALDEGRSQHAVTRHRRADGIAYWSELHLSPMRGQDNQLEAHVWVFKEISQQMALSELWRRYEFIVDTADDLLSLVRDDLTYAAMNRAFTQRHGASGMTEGRTVEAVWGKTVFRRLLQKPLAEAFAGTTARVEAWITVPGWGRRYLEFAYYPYQESSGAVTHAVETVHDITSRKRAEDALKALNDQLEQRVKDRTAELEGAVRELDAFGYTVAHDLSAPLRAMRTFLTMLGDEDLRALSKNGRRGLRLIDQGMTQMGRLLDDLQQFSRLGRKPVHRDPVDMAALAKQVIAELRAENPNREFRATIRPLPAAEGDAVLLHQVLMNLASNALKFSSPERKLRIEIGYEEHQDEPIYYVRDNGLGFDSSQAQNAFELFRRLGNAGDAEGTGAGLAIVKRIVEKHGGRVWASGRPNGGATFYFTLTGASPD